jgi:hypothetical protein
MLKHFLAALLLFAMGVGAFSADRTQLDLKNDVIVGGAQSDAQLTDEYVLKVQTGFNVRDQQVVLNGSLLNTARHLQAEKDEASALVSDTWVDNTFCSTISYPSISVATIQHQTARC